MFYEFSDDDFDEEILDKLDVEDVLNFFIEGENCSLLDDDEVFVLYELLEFFGDEDKISELLSFELVKIMEKMFILKMNLEKIKEIFNKYDRLKNINNVFVLKVNKVIWENMFVKNRVSDIKF